MEVRRVGRALKRLVHEAALAACTAWGAARLAADARRLRRARVIVVVPEGGFGHTIALCEAVRRLYPEAAPAVVWFSDRAIHHNPRVAALWPALRVHFVPLLVRIRLGRWAVVAGGATPARKEQLAARLRQVLRRCTAARVLSLHDVYEETARWRAAPAVMHARPSVGWVPGWSALVRGRPQPPSRLPDGRRRDIRRALARRLAASGGPLPPLCCVYLRKKDDGPTAARRSGSRVAAYVPGLQRVAAAGYGILVTGDRPLAAEPLGPLAAHLVTAETLGVEPGWFSLFAATEASLWMGDTGGGTWLPIVNQVPMLVLNVFPYGFAVPHAWLLYKTVWDAEGRRIPPQHLCAEHPYDYALEGLTVRENTAEEIEAGVAEWLADVAASAEAEGSSARWRRGLPASVVARHVPCRVTRTWLAAAEEASGRCACGRMGAAVAAAV